MKNEIDIAFALLSSALEGHGVSWCAVGSADKSRGPDVSMSAQNWWSIFRLMQKNRVAALCFDAVAAAGASREILMPWLAEREKTVDRYRYKLEVQQDIIERMQRHGIDTLVLKGTTLSHYYPEPELREFGDLDLYFYDRQAEADEIASKEMGVIVSNAAHHHSKYNYRGVTVESHYDFINVHYPPSNSHYEALLKGMSPSPTFEVLFLLRHMACHFAASRITLRDLVDWMLTCRTVADKVDCQFVKNTIKQYGMEPFAAAIAAIAKRRLGDSAPLTMVDDGVAVDPALLSRMEHDIVYGSVDDHAADGPRRLVWKLNRWKALEWKRRLVFSDSEARLLIASLTSHAKKPHSILHKQ